MKNAILICCAALLFSCKNNQTETTLPAHTAPGSASQTPIEADSFEEIVDQVTDAFRRKDNTALKSLTNDSLGIIIVYRSGVFNEYKKLDVLDLKHPFPENFSYPVITQRPKLQYRKLPTFDCGEMKWSDHGLYCDTISKDTLLSGVPANLRKYRGDAIPESEIKKLRNLEANSRRVVLADPSGDLIFYLTKTGGKWYLTALDRITTDCSA